MKPQKIRHAGCVNFRIIGAGKHSWGTAQQKQRIIQQVKRQSHQRSLIRDVGDG